MTNIVVQNVNVTVDVEKLPHKAGSLNKKTFLFMKGQCHYRRIDDEVDNGYQKYGGNES